MINTTDNPNEPKKRVDDDLEQVIGGKVSTMDDNTNDLAESKQLNDDDLTAVSGGSISISIMELADYLPEDSRNFAYSKLDGTIAGERQFLTVLESELELHGKDHAAAIVRAHRKYYWDRTFPE